MSSWNMLSKYMQWRKITSYMNENNIQSDVLFKRMRSLVSEKRTNNIVQYDIQQQKVIYIDFQHTDFNRERSKKGKLKAIQMDKNLEEDTIEILEEEHTKI